MGLFESSLKCEHCGCTLMFLSVNMSYFCPNANCPTKQPKRQADDARPTEELS